MHSNTHENIIDKYHCIWSTPNVFWNFQLHVPAVNAEHPIPRALAWNLNSKWCREVALFDRNLRKNLCFAVFECMRNLRENDFIQFSWNFIRITEPFECVRIARVRRWSSLVELICFFLVVYDIRVRSTIERINRSSGKFTAFFLFDIHPKYSLLLYISYLIYHH